MSQEGRDARRLPPLTSLGSPPYVHFGITEANVAASRRTARLPFTTIRTTLVCGLGLAAIIAGIVGAGRLADLLPAVALAACLIVLAVMALVGLVRS